MKFLQTNKPMDNTNNILEPAITREQLGGHLRFFYAQTTTCWWIAEQSGTDNPNAAITGWLAVTCMVLDGQLMSGRENLINTALRGPLLEKLQKTISDSFNEISQQIHDTIGSLQLDENLFRAREAEIINAGIDLLAGKVLELYKPGTSFILSLSNQNT